MTNNYLGKPYDRMTRVIDELLHYQDQGVFRKSILLH